MKKCVLAYSGGLDTSVMIPWLKEQGYEVYCVLADVGQKDDFDKIKENAFLLGAKDCEVVSCGDNLSEIFKYSSFLNAKYENQYFLGTALTRPFIAKAQIEYARSIGCNILVHGATGKGNDQIRFEYAYKTLASSIEVLSPWKYWEFTSRKCLISYLKEKGFNLGFSETKDYSIDKNVWHISIEGSELEKPFEKLSITEILEFNKIKYQGPEAKSFNIKFQDNELFINAEKYSFFQAIDFLNGQCMGESWAADLIIENRQTGIKSRGLYITPGAKILYKVFEGLVAASLNKKSFDHYEYLSKAFANTVYNGEYFSLQYQSIIAGTRSLMEHVSGEVIIETKPFLHLSKVLANKSFFKEELCTFEEGDISHADASGFINLSWLSVDGGCSL